MTAFYIVLKISALLAILILPLFGPKKKKANGPGGISKFAVNKNGHLEHFNNAPADRHLVQ
jgi:hypothetical protein